ncbi:NAD(P)-dependent oxidoreductase [Sedimentitalea sp. JM2-8]|uniref:NAD(P)-dependent oxidoreductase n=1 Tax=Sedimentitalea xiamensis TaxID=3050037 RepID=A0ABT7FF13_9RHOB|nr:NAD(P)-dependent oxidoreductase [Sedimentitalea xiamensis]MDK3073703.1 NAD(P)-dependent oxidoreductase [Sedimentitalea xiamensis]
MVHFGFVGLGQMGAPMARNLSRAHRVTAFATDGDFSGLTCAAGLADLAGCDRLILCLPSAEIVTNVLFGADGLAGKLAKGTVVIDTGTTEYNATCGLAERLETLGLRFVDAPVSGMRKRAEDATLTMMCGGDGDLIATLHPALSAMASKILHVGPVGSGQLMKLVNQLLFDINAAALAEILPLATRLGLNPEQVEQVVNSGTGRSFASEFFLPNVLNGDFRQGYPMRDAYKDLVSGAELTARRGIPTPVLDAATETYQRALLEGHGDKDKGAMILVFEKLLGAEFRAAPMRNASR